MPLLTIVNLALLDFDKFDLLSIEDYVVVVRITSIDVDGVHDVHVVRGSGCRHRGVCWHHLPHWHWCFYWLGLLRPGSCLSAMEHSRGGLRPLAVDLCWRVWAYLEGVFFLARSIGLRASILA